MKKVFKVFIIVFFGFVLVACNKTEDSELVIQQKEIYQLALEVGYKGTFEEWLQSIKGEQGSPGDNIELAVSGGYIKWQYVGETEWKNLVELSTLVGLQGPKGYDGKSSYEIYKVIYPDYEGDEQQWLDDLINGKLAKEEKFTVSFDSNGGNEVSPQDIEDGNKIQKPEDPIKIGFTFDGWYINENEKWIFDGYNVTEDIVLTAKWIEPFSEGLVFILMDNGYIVIDYYGTDELVYIPSSYQGKPVVGISKSAFENLLIIKDVHIPNTVKLIGKAAFNRCSNLKAVIFEEGSQLASIGDSAFSNCTSLTNIVIPEGVTSIGSGAIYGCTSLTSIVIPEGVTSIGDSAFSNCPSLTSINIPASMINIGAFAFNGCSNLTAVIFEEGSQLASIGDYAFYNCSSLTSINIPANMTSIGKYAFRNATSLTSIEIPERATSIGEGAFFDCTSLTSIVIPEGVTSIGSGAIYGCTSLTSIVIPEGVTSIGINAFYNCTSLTIYAEASSKPSGWSSNWNSSNRPVIWGYVYSK